MTHKIDKPIVGYKVLTQDTEVIQTPLEKPILKHAVIDMERPEILLGSTYKLKIPIEDSSIYITINDALLNEGTEFEERRPYEIFINSKNMVHYQWVIALTRVISLVFRRVDKIELILEELKCVFDPHGGYYKGGGVFVNSIVADIGLTIEKHLKIIGYLNTELDENTKKYIEEKKKEFMDLHSNKAELKEDVSPALVNATICTKCNSKSVIKLDNCFTCVECGLSHCN